MNIHVCKTQVGVVLGLTMYAMDPERTREHEREREKKRKTF